MLQKHHTIGQYTHGRSRMNMPGTELSGTSVFTLNAPLITAGAIAIAAGTKTLNDATACATTRDWSIAYPREILN